ncbi:MAG: TlpA family protein disulfide reductase [Bacteroidetes bacterium]|nr:TlpA family protein disulfide reductase [Bacteroidota bacterium]
MKTNKNLFFTILALLFFSTTGLIAQEADSVGYIVKDGDTAPQFTMTLTDGSQVSMADLKGKVVLLQFTASWCVVCRKEMPFLESEIWQEYKDKGLVMIGIDRDEPLETVQKFAKQMKITYPLALDPNADIFGLFALKQSGVTRNVIIDRNGRIVFKTRLFDREEFDHMKAKIKELIERK